MRVVADPGVTRHNDDQRGRLAELLRSRKMHSVEGANGFHWKRTANTSEDRVRDADKVTSSCEDLESSSGRAFVRRRESPSGSATHNGARGLCQRQRIRDTPTRRTYCGPRGRITFQERSDQGARFDVAECERDVWRRALGAYTWALATGRRPTLRHGRC